MGYFATSNRHISDPVLGSIPIFDDCDYQLLGLPLLQRLRRIKQLPAVCFVFPNADHSRFVHSLGAYYWAQHYAEALDLQEEDARLVRWGALLHDVGHYPCAHTLEKVYQRIRCDSTPISPEEPPATILADDAWASAATDPLRFVCWAPYPDDDWGDHEELTQYALQSDQDLPRIMGRAQPGFELGRILDVIRKDPPFDLALLRQVFHSQVDVDRMDYLVRDSQVAGARYGLVEPAHIIRRAVRTQQSLADEPVPGDAQTEREVIAYHEKAVPRLDHFLLARYFHYSNIIHHKTVLAFDLLLQALCAGLVAEGASGLPPDFDGVKELCDQGRFADFTDEVIYTAAAHRRHQVDFLGELAGMLLARIRPQCVIDLRCTRESQEGDGALSSARVAALLHLLNSRDRVKRVAEAAGVEIFRIGWISWELSFKKLYPFMTPFEMLDRQPTSESLLDQIWIAQDSGNPTLLASHEGSLIRALRDKSMVGVSVYLFAADQSKEAVNSLREAIEDEL